MASVWDLIVRLTGDSGQFREDMAQDKVALEELLSSAHDAAVSIKLDDTDAEAKLKAFDEELAALMDATAKIKLDDSAAELELDDFKKKLLGLKDTSMRIILGDADAQAKLDKLLADLKELRNSNIAVKIDDANSELKLDELKQKIRDLNNQLISIDVNDADAKAKVDDIKAKLDSIHNAIVRIKVDDVHAITDMQAIMAELDRLEARILEVNATKIDPQGSTNGVNGASNAASTAGKDATIFGMNPYLFGALATAATALIPAAASATTNVMGLAGALTAAGAGATGFGIVATGVLKPVFEALSNYGTEGKKAFDGLTAGQKEAAEETQQFEKAFKSFSNSFQSPVLKAYTEALQAAENIMKDMRPVISAAGTAIDGLLKQFDQFTAGNQFKQFMNWLAKETGPAIKSLGETFGNVMKGMMSLLEDFTPAIKPVENGLVSLSAGFAKWAAGLSSSKSFKEFLDYAKTEGPIVWQTLKELGGVIKNVVVDLAPFGGAVLDLIDSLAKFVNELLNGNSATKNMIEGVVLAAAGLIEFAAEIINVITYLLDFNNYAGVAKQVWTDFWNFFVNMGLSLSISWQNFLNNLYTLGQSMGKATATAVENTLGALKQWFTNLLQGIGQSFQSGWQQLKQYGQNGAKSAYDAVTDVWNAITKWFSTLWGDVSKGIQTGWDAIKKAASSAASDTYKAVTNVWNAIKKWFTDLWDDISHAIPAGWGDIESALGTAAKSAVKAITDEFKSLDTFFSDLAKEALQWGENVVSMIAQGIENAIGKVKSAVSDVANAIGNFLGFHSPTKEGPASDSDTWAPNFVNMFASGLEAGIPRVQAALNQVMVPPNVANMVTQAGTQLANQIASSTQNIAHINFNAPIYGVDDLQAAIQGGISQFVNGVQVAARSAGIAPR